MNNSTQYLQPTTAVNSRELKSSDEVSHGVLNSNPWAVNSTDKSTGIHRFVSADADLVQRRQLIGKTRLLRPAYPTSTNVGLFYFIF